VKGKVTGSAGTNVQASSIEVRRPNENSSEGSDAIDPREYHHTSGKDGGVDSSSPCSGTGRDGRGTIRVLPTFRPDTSVRAVPGFRRHGPVGKGLGDDTRASDPGPRRVPSPRREQPTAVPSGLHRPWPSRDRRSTQGRAEHGLFPARGSATDGATFFQDLSIGRIVYCKEGDFQPAIPADRERRPGKPPSPVGGGNRDG